MPIQKGKVKLSSLKLNIGLFNIEQYEGTEQEITRGMKRKA